MHKLLQVFTMLEYSNTCVHSFQSTTKNYLQSFVDENNLSFRLEMEKSAKVVCRMSFLWFVILIGIGALAYHFIWVVHSEPNVSPKMEHLQKFIPSPRVFVKGSPSLSSTTVNPTETFPASASSTMTTKTNRRCAPFPNSFDPKDALFTCNMIQETKADCNQRLRATLSCSSTSADILFNWVSLDTPPALYQYEDKCLENIIKERCYDGRVIPRLMHFVSFSRRELPFYGFLSVISAVRFVQPCLVLFHGDYLPFGDHWNVLERLVPNILHINRTKPTSIFGNVINVLEHSADVARLEAIRKFGGVYMDTDHILLNPLASLRNHSVVMGIEIPGSSFNNGMFMGKSGAEFLDIWYMSYSSFKDGYWAAHSTAMPYKLHNIFPELELHVVNSFFTPHFRHIKNDFYLNKYNWTELYGIHLYYRLNKEFFNGSIETQNSSLGEITRHVLYGNSELCFNQTDELEPVRMKV